MFLKFQRSEPAIIHGNLTCDTIFIQHNGLVKIGSIAPDVIHQTARATDRDTGKNLHYLAPEWSKFTLSFCHFATFI